ncbi:MAG: hypothetical protein Q9221_006734 [Calogaya cf. arnoldii]
MAYQRGTTSSYQKWADEVGDESYTFERLLPFFEKSLKFTPPDSNFRFANGTPEYDPTVLEDGSRPLGLLEIGIPIIKNFQSGALLGHSYSMCTINATDTTRDSSETSFLRRGLAYHNYIVYQSTFAKRILFNGNKTATGVVVDTQGLQYTLHATKEVILSAASLAPHNSSSSLVSAPTQLSNKQDHIYFGQSYRVNAPTFSSLSNPLFAAQAALEYNTNASGILTNPTGDVLAWEKNSHPSTIRFLNFNAPFSGELSARLARNRIYISWRLSRE